MVSPEIKCFCGSLNGQVIWDLWNRFCEGIYWMCLSLLVYLKHGRYNIKLSETQKLFLIVPNPLNPWLPQEITFMFLKHNSLDQPQKPPRSTFDTLTETGNANPPASPQLFTLQPFRSSAMAKAATPAKATATAAVWRVFGVRIQSWLNLVAFLVTFGWRGDQKDLLGNWIPSFGWDFGEF